MGEIFYLQLLYRIDRLCITRMFTVHFRWRAVPIGAPLIFIKEKSELLRFVLDCDLPFLNIIVYYKNVFAKSVITFYVTKQ